MPDIPFGEWLPDTPDLGQNCTKLVNLFPVTKQSYGPIKKGLPFTAPVTGRIIGDYSIIRGDGVVFDFLGTDGHLWLMKSGEGGYSEVTANHSTGGIYSDTSGDVNAAWNFTSFGTLVLATNYLDAIQCFDIKSDTEFSILSTAAPHAKYITTVRDFVMVGWTDDKGGGLGDGEVPFRVQWCAVGDPRNWPLPGSDAAIMVSSDFQDLQQTDLGNISGLVGGHMSAADGAAIMQEGVYRIQFAGAPNIFDFAVAQSTAGTHAPNSIVKRLITGADGSSIAVVYYHSTDGFIAFNGSSSVLIGDQKVDKYFLDTVSVDRLASVKGVIDAERHGVMWFFHGVGDPTTYFTRIIGFHWGIGRWGYADIRDQPMQHAGMSYSAGGYTLDGLDVFGPLDSLSVSLDSRAYVDATPMFVTWGPDGRMYLPTGPNRAVTIESGEMPMSGDRRTWVQSTRPLVDGGPASIYLGLRDKMRDPVRYTPPVPENIIGRCPQRDTGLYVRIGVQLPEGTAFKHLLGVNVTARPEARLR